MLNSQIDRLIKTADRVRDLLELSKQLPEGTQSQTHRVETAELLAKELVKQINDTIEGFSI